MIARQLCLVSACLVGLCTRYDCCSKQNQDCLPLLLQFDWIPVCPEQLGGLPTPRLPAQIMGGDGHAVLAGHAMVIDPYGRDLTPFFCPRCQHGTYHCPDAADQYRLFKGQQSILWSDTSNWGYCRSITRPRS